MMPVPRAAADVRQGERAAARVRLGRLVALSAPFTLAWLLVVGCQRQSRAPEPVSAPFDTTDMETAPVAPRGEMAGADAFAHGDSLLADSLDLVLRNTLAVVVDTSALAARLLHWSQVWPAPAPLTFRAALMPDGSPRLGTGPGIFRLQVLLDRAGFSPGALDARWNPNTRDALVWFQRAAGLDSTGELDGPTYDRLLEAASRDPVIAVYVVSAQDVAGPFTPIPSGVYEKAELSCLCYSSVAEAIGERFHTSPAILAALNAGVRVDSLVAGVALRVPNVDTTTTLVPPAGREIAGIAISKTESWLHALDGAGGIVYHFPSTLGSRYDPSPAGRLEVRSVMLDPWFRYQPRLFTDVPDDRPEARLPPGPNSPVGVVWIALSKPHYGIHGTAVPEAIGRATSHGCVRLTNWDARALASVVVPGTPVEFVTGLPPEGVRSQGGAVTR
jgi:lipoprotein-anchoring transpeptidase ErfK/SrfK